MKLREVFLHIREEKHIISVFDEAIEHLEKPGLQIPVIDSDETVDGAYVERIVGELRVLRQGHADRLQELEDLDVEDPNGVRDSAERSVTRRARARSRDRGVREVVP
jgi:hypothetical protein